MAYATATDLSMFGAPAVALGDVMPAEVDGQLDAASSLADSYLRLHYTLPLTAPYPVELVEAVSRIAAYNLLSVRGYNPEGDAGTLETRYKAAISWLRDVGSGKAAPIMVTADPGGTRNAGGPFVVQSRYDSTLGTSISGTPSTRGW